MEYKFYVSYDAARLLKEKGYDNYSIVYDCSVKGDILLNQRPIDGEWAGDKDIYPCPSKSEAIDWLEQVHGIRIEIRMKHCKIKGDPMEIKDTDEYAWRWFYVICIGDDVDNPILEEESEGSEYVKLFNSRLEAENAAIIQASKEITKL